MSRRLQSTVERVADVVLRSSGLLALFRGLDSRDGRTLRVLVYHRVHDAKQFAVQGDPSLISATPDTFAAQVKLLAKFYTPIGIGDLATSLAGENPLPPRAVLVTFDDGYRDFLIHAWPILKAHGVPAVLFVSSAHPDSGQAFWWDELWRMLARTTTPTLALEEVGSIDLRTPEGRRAAMLCLRKTMRPLRPDVIEERMAELRDTLGAVGDATPSILTWDELRRLASEGVTIASHAQHHVSMLSLTEAEIASEVDGSVADLTRELGVSSRVWAYPFGHHDHRTAAILEARGFLAAFVLRPGRNVFPVQDRFAILRHSVNVNHSMSRLLLSLAGFYPLSAVRLGPNNVRWSDRLP